MYKFIIVDDEPLIRRGILKKLETYEKNISFAGEADNGEDALKLVHKINPDIIITDMRMPLMDGKSLLKLIQKDYPEKKIIVISGYSDFEYMKEAISANVVSYLLKPFNREELHKTLTKAISLIERDNSIQQKIELIEDEKEQISYNSDLQSLSSIILDINKKDAVPSIRSGKLKIIDNADSFLLLSIYSTSKLEEYVFYNYMEQNDLNNSCIFLPHPYNDQICFFILLYSEQLDNKIIELASQTAKNLIEIFSSSPLTEVFIGISNIKHNIIELRQAYKETVSALDSRKIFDNSIFHFFTDDTTVPNSFEWENSDDLVFYIESGNTQKITELTRDLFEFFSRDPLMTLAVVKRNCRSLLKEARDLLHEYFDSMPDNTLPSSYETIIDTLFDINSIRAYLLQVLSNISLMLGQKAIYSSENIIDNIKTYVQKNYSKNLTLEKISSLFFINPSYCSYLFKEKSGDNFIDFINKVRIQKATELLRNSDNKVYKIAKTIGFDNTKYFFRVFKKVTGYTPKEYKAICDLWK
ncbi:two-component system response regulator YesN [Anaerobacterium chartisolvens]|uniref:Stage 0 sporulation protein A homolog n=1 Tax=Anaerobacterium chartisolvens TaxID=1297424 RepID=A0A369BBP2_9FIRM|nr:response regulator [Anaerobacterium chartisolvens]RCX17887.1 two-component system response regulator YesN [Anaerobacterium chartisolvens]